MQPELISRNAQIVSDYYQTHNMRETGSKFGITYERVRQIIVRYEKRTGTHVPRTKPKPPRYCSTCGKNLLDSTNHHGCANRAKGQRNIIARSKQIEEWLHKRTKGYFWHIIGYESGIGLNYSLPRNVGSWIQETCYKYILVTNQHSRIPTYWPNGIPNWLKKKAEKYRW